MFVSKQKIRLSCLFQLGNITNNEIKMEMMKEIQKNCFKCLTTLVFPFVLDEHRLADKLCFSSKIKLEFH